MRQGRIEVDPPEVIEVGRRLSALAADIAHLQGALRSVGPLVGELGAPTLVELWVSAQDAWSAQLASLQRRVDALGTATRGGGEQYTQVERDAAPKRPR